MDTIENIKDTNPKGKMNYILNSKKTAAKIKQGVGKPTMHVEHNNGSKTINFSTGAYINIVLPLVKAWLELEGNPILADQVDGMDITVSKFEIKTDQKNTKVHYAVKLLVDGLWVTVTCYDTTLTMLVQAGPVLEPYCSRVLIPYLEREVKSKERQIKETNAQAAAQDEPKATTRNQHKLILQGASILEPPSTPRSVRLFPHASPAPRALPGTLPLPLSSPVEKQPSERGLESRAAEVLPLGWQVLEVPPLEEVWQLERRPEERQLLALPPPTSQDEEVTVEKLLCSSPVRGSRTLPLQLKYVPDDDLEARHGLLEAIVTSRSQIVPDFGWRMAVNSSISDESILDASKVEENEDDASNKEQNKTDNAEKGEYDTSVIHVENVENNKSNNHIVTSHMYGAELHCTVCGKLCKTVDSLQFHLLSNHCQQPETVLQQLKRQEETILEMHSYIKQITISQTNILDDMKQVKSSLLRENASSCVAPCPAIPVPAPQAPCPPVQSQPPSYAATAQAQVPQGPQEARQRRQKPVKKISYVGDSIAHHVMFEELERITKAKITKRKAYGAIKSSDQLFPTANFVDTVPKEMRENNPDVLVLQQDSVTLTDLSPGAPEEYNKQQVKIASFNMFAAATDALAVNPDCQQVLIMQAAPRYDGKEELNRYGNDMLYQARAKSNSKDKSRVKIGVHKLECEGGLRASRYGDGRNGQVDMLHLRGASGKVSFTRSVAAMLAEAGLATVEEAEQVGRNMHVEMKKPVDEGYRIQNRRGSSGAGQQQGGARQQRDGARQQQRGTRQHRGMRQQRGGARQAPTFQIATHNMFGELSGDC